MLLDQQDVNFIPTVKHNKPTTHFRMASNPFDTSISLGTAIGEAHRVLLHTNSFPLVFVFLSEFLLNLIRANHSLYHCVQLIALAFFLVQRNTLIDYGCYFTDTSELVQALVKFTYVRALVNKFAGWDEKPP